LPYADYWDSHLKYALTKANKIIWKMRFN
jgi:hypothetical protein